MNRYDLATLMQQSISQRLDALRADYTDTRDKIGLFVVDDLLPDEVAREIHAAFPGSEDMKLNKSLREYKYIAAQMNNYDPSLEEVIYAFQDPRVVSLIGKICDIEDLRPDVNLYAGGISLMGKDNYLNPHLDNSHDKDRSLWRVLNLLYYVTPDWKREYGGNLELWPGGVREKQVTVFSKFNRLAVMTTHQNSWHSVSPVKVDRFRCCVSNYYFSSLPIRASDTFHVTSFRGRPGQFIRDSVLRADAKLRMLVRRVFKRGIVDTGHIYKKPDSPG